MGAVIVALALACRAPAPSPWEDGALVLRWGDDERLRIDAITLGVATSDDPRVSYDPAWPFVNVSLVPAAPGEPIPVEGGVDVPLSAGGIEATLEVRAPSDGRIDVRLAPTAGVPAVVRLEATIDPAEGLYGLGEHLDHVDNRGQVRAMQIEADAITESGYNEAHVPVPLLVGTTGWGWFVADDHPMTWEVATAAADRVAVTTGLGPDGADGLTFHLYAADAALDVYPAFHEDVGAPGAPPDWAYGPLVWRNENEDQAQFLADLAAIRALDLPVSGVWLDRPYASGVNTFDFAEDVVVGIAGYRLPWRFADGRDERTLHARYADLYHGVYAEVVDRPFLLCRAGAWGDARHGCVIWPGDLDATLDAHAADAGDYVAVGGLPAAMIAGLSVSASGYPFYASDTGGYRHSPADAETFARWLTAAAVWPVMQIGTGSSDVVWEPVADWDDALLSTWRDAARLHLRLFPYVRSFEATRPIVRPLGLVHPEVGHPDDVWLLGDDLLAAPVLTRGATTRSLVLPDGDWADWWTGARVASGAITVDAPRGALPLFVRGGAIIPLLDPETDTLAPASDPGVRAWPADPGVPTIRLFPTEDGHRASVVGEVTVRVGDAIEVDWSPAPPVTDGVWFEVLGGDWVEVRIDGVAVARRATIADAASEGGYVASGAITTIRVPEGSRRVSLVR